ncbi:hypothetical protein DRH29_01725 [candidate division Kazan bacterium]|uniref:Uncharacterized protein n=1 Tax=candidate division Kazan bacterium TaxID=2202143 RepID=A0A420ZDC2_UNCK3|nr:MAG: hypothetical protein DRH29_01725 [candidate division Kazan bacterium]
MEGKPSYPCSDYSPESWDDVTIYAITGWMSQSWDGRDDFAVAFGGYFKLLEKEGALKGQIVDQWGTAIINGTLKGDTLLFDKHYDFLATPITYPLIISFNLTKEADGHWRGTYQMSGGLHGNGTVECIVEAAIPNAFGVSSEAHLS